MRTRDSIHRKNSPFYGPERFAYQPESNRYICPAGQPFNYGGRNLRNRTYGAVELAAFEFKRVSTMLL